jgi:hypothetical protein
MSEPESEPEKHECPERIALEHAIRCWDAETQNAERLASRENGLLTLLSAIVGFGFFKLSEDGDPTYASLAIRGFLTIVLLLLLIALISILVNRWPRRGTRGASPKVPFASGRLAWPNQRDLRPHELASEEVAIRIALSLTTDAAAHLLDRNVARRARLDLGQQALVAAIVCAGFGFAVYVWSGFWSQAREVQPTQPPPAVRPR